MPVRLCRFTERALIGMPPAAASLTAKNPAPLGRVLRETLVERGNLGGVYEKGVVLFPCVVMITPIRKKRN